MEDPIRDMLVNLSGLPSFHELEESISLQQILIRQPIAPERSIVMDWVEKHFARSWADEVAAAFSHQPITCFVAQKEGEILGFACYEATKKNFFGPTGVSETARGMGLGKVLLMKSLEAMKNMGYAYAIIGGVRAPSFYEKAVRAQSIAESGLSIYQDMLKA
ncbi:MAG: GNAT family N-acetyltransferase [Cytophagales bacterium]|nr:GNAT family N-acetyltransferase [Cytophagales bacterium]